MKYKTYTNVLNVRVFQKISIPDGGNENSERCVWGRGGDMTSSPVIGGGSKTKVPLDLDSFWNYTKVIIKDYGLHFDLVD